MSDAAVSILVFCAMLSTVWIGGVLWELIHIRKVLASQTDTGREKGT